MNLFNSYYLFSFVRVLPSRNNFPYLNTTFFLVVSIAIGTTLVVSLPLSEVSAQLLSEERRNESTERLGRTNDSSTDSGLLSMLLEPGTTRRNLSSVADTMFAGIEEGIDDRLNSIKSKLDEIAAVVLPLVIASVRGIALFASLIVAFILISWYDRFKIYRKNRRDFKNMAEHLLVELKNNMDLIRSSSAKTRSNESLNEAINQNRYIANEELSAAAMKASISDLLPMKSNKAIYSTSGNLL